MGSVIAALLVAASLAVPRFDNPVSESFADTFADPVIVTGDDGYYYGYGTTDPLREGEGTPHRIPMARSTDLVNWSYVGDAFTDRSARAAPRGCRGRPWPAAR
jgi:arabinan endo-1,5-alpha-L-arabinosidase